MQLFYLFTPHAVIFCFFSGHIITENIASFVNSKKQTFKFWSNLRNVNGISRHLNTGKKKIQSKWEAGLL